MSKRWLSYLAVCIAIATAYYVLGALGLSLAYLHSSASAVWPPSGLALVAMLLLGYRIWPAVLVGAFWVNITTSGNFGSSVVIAIGNTLEALIGAYLTGRFAGGRQAFEQAQNIFRFIFFAAIPSTAVSATIGVAALGLFGLAAWTDFSSVWIVWWLGDFVSDITVAPLLLIWAISAMETTTPDARPGWRARLGAIFLPSARTVVEAMALTAAVVSVSYLIFRGPAFGTLYYPIEFLGLPLLICAAFRFQQRGAATMACLMSAIAIDGTLDGYGPFANSNPNTSLVLLQMFMGVMSVTALVVAALVAEQKRVEQQLRVSRNEATSASQAKDQFLAVLSHELRTPLTPVLLTVSTLERDASLPVNLRDDLSLIRRNVELEARLIDDLLDLTRIARGKLQLSLEVADLHDLIRWAIGISCDGSVSVRTQLDARHHHVRADPARLQQVFWNLLNNAQKFTPAGGTITIRTWNDPTDQSIIAEVADTGVGIEPELFPRLFTAFEQGEASTLTRKAGLGLGLAISRALVAAHGGELTAASEGRGRGAAFTVRLTTLSASKVESPPPSLAQLNTASTHAMPAAASHPPANVSTP